MIDLHEILVRSIKLHVQGLDEQSAIKCADFIIKKLSKDDIEFISKILELYNKDNINIDIFAIIDGIHTIFIDTSKDYDKSYLTDDCGCIINFYDELSFAKEYNISFTLFINTDTYGTQFQFGILKDNSDIFYINKKSIQALYKEIVNWINDLQ